MLLDLLLVIVIVLAIVVAVVAPAPRRFRAGAFAVAALAPLPTGILAAVGVTVGTRGGLLLATAAGVVLVSAFWALRMDPATGGPEIDWEQFERKAFEDYRRYASWA